MKAQALQERDLPHMEVREKGTAVEVSDGVLDASVDGCVDESWELDESLVESSLADKELLDGLLASLRHEES